MLARLHLAGRDFPQHQPTCAACAWWQENVPAILPFLADDQRALIETELAHQAAFFGSADYAALPRRPVPCRPVPRQRDVRATADHVRLGGFFDFYFAGVDKWLFDVAVCVNDWCIDLADRRARPVARRRDAARATDGAPVHARRGAALERHAARRRAALLGVASVRFPSARAKPKCSSRTIPAISNASCANASKPRPIPAHGKQSMQLIEVPAKTGYVWFRQGIWLFRSNPLAFLTVFFAYLFDHDADLAHSADRPVSCRSC